MQWKADYATGIHNIDDQHKTILEIVTRFETIGDGGTLWHEMHPLIVRTREFMEFHFCVEESLMRLLPYPDLSAHRAEHQNALERIAELEHRAVRENSSDRLVPSLCHLLFGHITGSDKRFAQCALDHFAGASSRRPNR